MSNWTSNFGIKQISSFSFCTYGIFYEDFPCLNVSRIPLAAQKQSPTTPFFVWPQFLHHSSRHVAFDIPSLFFGVSFLFLIWLLFLIYPDVTLVNFHECVQLMIHRTQRALGFKDTSVWWKLALGFRMTQYLLSSNALVECTLTRVQPQIISHSKLPRLCGLQRNTVKIKHVT